VTRVVQLANFYSETSGGLRVAVDRLAHGYRQAGDDVTLITPAASGSARTGRVKIASPRIPNGSGYRVITSRRAVHRVLDAVEPDVVEVHDKLLLPWVARWARGRDVSVIAVSHERLDATLAQFLPRMPVRAREFAAASVRSGVLRRADLVVACSRFAAAEYGPAPKVRVVALGVDLDEFPPKLEAASPSGLLQLVCVSRLSAEKRPDVAIATLAELLDRNIPAHLTVLGSGPWEARLRTQAHGLPVSFLGFVDRRAVAAAIGAADIALVPGPAETFGLAALEALAGATPIVVVAASGAAELIEEHPTAGVAAALDPRCFADAVCALLEVPADVRRNSARGVALQFGWGGCVDAMREIHRELRESART
jgi:alpha-1,6-mannosyltransferase